MPVNASILSESNTENTSVQEPGTLPAPEEITLPGTDNTPTDPSGGIVPYWGTSDHVNKQCEYVISQLGLSSSQAAWLKDGCGCVDGKFSNIRGFHAKKKTNYLACIKALFMFGQLVGKNDTGLTKKEVVFQAMPKLDAAAKQDIVDMFDDNTHTYTTNYPKLGTKVKVAAPVYEDNPLFMPKRFNAAKQASVSFIKQIRTNSNFNTVNFYLGNYNLNFDKFNEFQAIIS